MASKISIFTRTTSTSNAVVDTVMKNGSPNNTLICFVVVVVGQVQFVPI